MVGYNSVGIPGDMQIRCPRCGACASYMTPFAFYSQKQGPPADVQSPTHNWGSYLVVELYPAIMPWSPPSRGAGYTHSAGVVLCPVCHLAASHKLDWPEDAFYRWDIRGNTLWACSAEHARAILAFLSSAERNENLFGPYARSLRKLPSEFLSAKVRERIAKAIRRSLPDTDC